MMGASVGRPAPVSLICPFPAERGYVMYEGIYKIAAAAGAFTVMLSGAVPAVSAGETENKVKVMCFGDSITDGFWLPGGYRNTLCSLLTEQGRAEDVDFVGPNWGGSGYDPQHAGYSGFSITDIAQADSISGQRTGISGFAGALMDNYQPDVVLLQIGTNDILSLYDLAHLGERLEALTDCITEKLPENGMLYLATLPVMDATNTLYISEYYFDTEKMDASVALCNTQIRDLAKKMQAEGKPVQLAEINKLLTKDDLFDGVHPSEEGYRKMGQFWYEQLTAYLDGESVVTEPQETTAPPEPEPVRGDLDGDGACRTADAVLLTKHLSTAQEMTAEQAARADLDGNRIINAADLTLLKREILYMTEKADKGEASDTLPG